MKVYEIIFQQLGGNRFAAMTGSKRFVGDGNTLEMQLAKNKSKANRLAITLDEGKDLYTMRFYKYTPGRFNRTTCEFTEDKVVEVELFEDVFCDQLQEIFTEVTGLYTHF